MKSKIKNNQLCSTCHGEGYVGTMKCYGGEPVEDCEPCCDCDGEGYMTKKDIAHYKKTMVRDKKLYKRNLKRDLQGKPLLTQFQVWGKK